MTKPPRSSLRFNSLIALAALGAMASASAPQAMSKSDLEKADVHLYGDISKVDDEQRIVSGYASTTSLDMQGESVTKAAMEDALPEYMKFANIREMHGASAVGVCKSASVDDKGLYIEVHVADDNAWKKIKAGVYKGFSIGGKSLAKASGVISKMRLSEISLVDRPANPECVIDTVKVDGVEPDAAALLKAAQESAIDGLVKLLDGGAVDPVALLAFAKGEHGKTFAGEATPATTTNSVVDAAATPAAAPAPAVAKAAGGVTHAFEIANGTKPVPAAEQAPWQIAKAEKEAAEAAALAKANGVAATPAAAPAPAPAAAAPAAAVAPTVAELVAKAEAAAAEAAAAIAKAEAEQSAVAVEQPAPIMKGMGASAALAMLLKQLAYLTQDQKAEATQEGDASVVPGLMHDLLVQGGQVLVAMVTEAPAAISPVTLITLVSVPEAVILIVPRPTVFRFFA